MAKERLVRVVSPAVNAGARSGPTAIPTFDDNKVRTLTGIKVNGTTALIHVQLDVAGRVFADLDESDFSTAEGYEPLQQDFQPGVQFSWNVINDSAGNLAVNVLVAELRYDTPD